MVDLKLNFPNSFMNEELRNGYIVTSEMKKIWAVELDLFAEFDRVCRKYNITYIASGGTMLGAVRHHGFIPWDDDVDLMMTRDQYDRLCEIAPMEFRHPYFFQTHSTDKGYMRGFARLRNSETTAIQKRELQYRLPYNQGIFIDIFPMDNVTCDKKKYANQVKSYFYYKKLFSYFNVIETGVMNENVSSFERVSRKALSYTIGKITKMLGLSKYYFDRAQKECMKYNKEEVEYISLLSFQIDNLKHAIHASDMFHIEYLDFEFLKIPVISNYDEHLRLKYGDYMIPQQSPTYHGDVIFDVNQCYKSYFGEHSNV